MAQLGTVAFLLLEGVRKYSYVAGYCFLQLFTSLLEIIVNREFGSHSRQYRIAFWTDEIGLDLLLFLILIVLTYRAMEGSPLQSAMRGMLVAGTVIVVALPFVLFQGMFAKPSWFEHTSQSLNFGAAIVDLGLWTALLRSPHRDPKLMRVSAGFGIVAAGVAMSFGLRSLIHARGAAYTAASTMFVLAHLAGAMLLCWAFRPDFAGYWSPSKPNSVVAGTLVP
jgi:hypothetical protein